MKVGDLIRSKYSNAANGIVVTEPRFIDLHNIGPTTVVDVMWSFGECAEIPVRNLEIMHESR